MSVVSAAYIRVSTEDQIEFSPDSQRKRIEEYAAAHDMQIPESYVFVDEGISGRTADKRPAFQQMIALARAGRHQPPFQNILVWKFSRFARSRQDSIFYKSMLRKECGIEVISITEPLSHDPTAILIEALLEAMDEYYSINLAQEVRRGMQERFSRGRAISTPPFGYRMGEVSFEPHPEQAPWVSYMFQAYASGTSLKDIAAHLRNLAILTTHGNLFEPRSVAYILLNPVYIGKLRKRSRPAPSQTAAPLPLYDRNYTSTPMDYTDGIHPALISDALWKQVQTRWQKEHPSDPSDALFTHPALPASYYLKGLVYCDSCNRPLVQIHKGTAFQCSGYNHGLCHCSHYISRQKLEAMVMHVLSEPDFPLPPACLATLSSPVRSVTAKNQLLIESGISFRYHKAHTADDTDSLEIISAIGRSGW